jgi:hypothetical protein
MTYIMFRSVSLISRYRLHGGVDTALAGHLHDRLQGLAVGAVDGCRGAEALRYFKAIVVEIDHDDLKPSGYQIGMR